MGLIDSTFASIPNSLMPVWGQDLTYVKTTTPRAYDPATGEVTGADTEVSFKGVILRLTPRESEGLYQSTDLKIILGTTELGTYYPSEADRIKYTQDGATREAKIISITTYRGDNPVYHSLIVRPQ
ncbi:MAG: hypothetical protein EBY40_02525 [Marivivens sp.]|nr:hypothetical protein [Marivivens sp.]NBT50458.1 hypothetical protein [Marivivens sp.]NCW67694.1 hypothetical protein [Marivivens sp.]NDH01986.1 hypothetical protein [Marivivens sp.]